MKADRESAEEERTARQSPGDAADGDIDNAGKRASE
jgi:hypothetical protein